MDVRTSQLLRALDPLAVDVLLCLHRKELSEKALVEGMGGPHQPTVHKKLKRLADAGLVRQPGDAAGRGAAWVVAAPDETADLLAALLALANALDDADRRQRERTRARLLAAGSAKPAPLRVIEIDR